ncbi:hypothetical protein WMF30_31635 [Sorangium sp. So ce134]
MKHLFAVHASFGHLLPAMRLAELVLDRGHEALFVASDRYSALLDLHRLEHVAISNTGRPFLSTHDWYDVGTVGIQVQLLSKIVEQYQPDVLVTGPLGLATFMVAELHSIPAVVLGYGEYLYPGLRDADRTRWWRLRTITSFYNECRKAQGLEPVEADPEVSPLLGACYLLRNVPEFTSPPELPARVRHVGGLYWEPTVRDPRVRRFVKASRGRYRRVVYVQMGRLFDKPWIWTRLMSALDELGIACVADLDRADYLQDIRQAPPNALVARFAPVGSVEGADAVICTGHTAAVLGAITHRKPLLCIPTSADTDEIAARVSQCGLGTTLSYGDGLHRASFERFFEQVDRGDFTPGLTRFHDYLEDWKQTEASLGDIGLSLLGGPRREAGCAAPAVRRHQPEPA